jgi:hypothetical protein
MNPLVLPKNWTARGLKPGPKVLAPESCSRQWLAPSVVLKTRNSPGPDELETIKEAHPTDGVMNAYVTG